VLHGIFWRLMFFPFFSLSSLLVFTLLWWFYFHLKTKMIIYIKINCWIFFILFYLLFLLIFSHSYGARDLHLQRWLQLPHSCLIQGINSDLPHKQHHFDISHTQHMDFETQNNTRFDTWVPYNHRVFILFKVVIFILFLNFSSFKKIFSLNIFLKIQPN